MAFRFWPHRVDCPVPKDEDHVPSSSQPGFILGLLGVLLFAAGLLAPWWARWLPDAARPGPAVAWLIVLLGLAWMAWTFGWWYRATWRGVLVTGRNVASLSVLQAVAWSILLVSLLVVVAAWAAPGLGGKAVDEAGLQRPDEPLGEVGLQVAAVAGTSAASVGILAKKKRRVPVGKALEGVAKADVARRPGRHAAGLAKALRAEPPAILRKGFTVEDQQRRTVQQAEMVLGRLQQVGPAVAPPGLGHAAAEDVAKDFRASLARMAAKLPQDRVEAFLTDLLQTRVPDEWEALASAYKLPPIEVTRGLVKRLVQAAATAEVGRQRTGSVYERPCACLARFTDMLEGDEVLDHASKDSSKIQFLLVTLGSLLAMALWAWHQMDVGSYDEVFLPGLPEGMSLLSGATAAGYVAGKVPQRTPVEGMLP